MYSRRGSGPVLGSGSAGQLYKDSHIRAWDWGGAQGAGVSPGPGRSSQCAPAMDKHSCLRAIPQPGMGFPLLLPLHTLQHGTTLHLLCKPGQQPRPLQSHQL